MKPEAFVFDIGNVLLHFDFGRARRALMEAGATLPPGGVLEEIGARYERGAISRESFLGEMSRALGGTVPSDLLASAWQDIFTPNEAMWGVVDSLHGRYPLYLLSNTNGLHLDHMRARYPIFAKFSDGVYSHQAKLMKPEPAIYAEAIRRFGIRPEATIYIDDIDANVAAGRTAGLRAILYRAGWHDEFLRALSAEGVQCV